MSKADFAALIALCAALASAIGDVIRQRSAQEVLRTGVESLAATRGARVFIAHVSTVAWKRSCEEG